MKLIKPREDFFEEYYAAVKESYENKVAEWMPFQLEYYDEWKKQILQVLDNYEKGVDIPDGMPITYTRWCVEQNAFIGEIQVRPFLSEPEAKKWGHVAYAVRYTKWKQGYGTKLLQAAVKQLREFDVSTVYIACHKDNINSIRVIEKNGGRYMDSAFNEEGEEENIYVIEKQGETDLNRGDLCYVI